MFITISRILSHFVPPELRGTSTRFKGFALRSSSERSGDNHFSSRSIATTIMPLDCSRDKASELLGAPLRSAP